LPLLAGRDRLHRLAEAGGPPGLDFDENKRLPVPGDDIDFASEETEASGQDSEIIFFKVFGGDFLPRLPQLPFRSEYRRQ
jgi:hypothetical protein